MNYSKIVKVELEMNQGIQLLRERQKQVEVESHKKYYDCLIYDHHRNIYEIITGMNDEERDMVRKRNIILCKKNILRYFYNKEAVNNYMDLQKILFGIIEEMFRFICLDLIIPDYLFILYQYIMKLLYDGESSAMKILEKSMTPNLF